MKAHMIAALLLLTGSLTAVAEIASSPDNVTPLRIGDQIPNPTLTKLDGQKIQLADVLGGKPSVLIFFRGGWCPYCTKHLAALKEVIPQVKELGFEVVAISPDSIESSQKAVTEKEIDYTVLSDSNFEAIQKFGLAFKLDDETLVKYDGYGIKLVPMPETGDKILPVPAVYLVDAHGVIQFRHYDADYKQRLDPAKLLDAVNNL